MATKRKTLERSGAGLLESVREFENLSFAKGWAEDLETDGEGSRDAAAGDGDARKAGE